VSIGIRSAPTAGAVSLVARQEVDFAITYGLSGEEAGHSERIGVTKLAAMLRRDHALASRKSITLDELGRHRVLSYRQDTPFGIALWHVLNESGAALEISTRVACTDACILSEKGAGVALVDRLMLATGLFPNLVSVPVEPEVVVEIQLLRPRGRLFSRLASEYLEHILNEISAVKEGFEKVLLHGG
jgi:DNA-binding transcriptional LysR family regulator